MNHNAVQHGHPRRHALVPWVGLYGGAWDLWAPESYAHPAKGSPGLFFRILAHLAELGLLRPGDTVLDPMCGVGSTLLCASMLGFDSVGVELEPRWAGLARANIARLRGARGKATVLQGDARRLPELLAAQGYVAVTSPPYSEAPTGGGIMKQGYKPTAPSGRLRHPGGQSPIDYLGKRTYTPETHGTSPAQIGNLKDKGLIGITSPPYGDAEVGRLSRRDGGTGAHGESDRRLAGSADYGAAPGQIGALPDRGMVGVEQPTYASEMLQVYQGLAQVCKGLCVVVKNPTREGKLRRLDRDTARLLRLAGWRIIDYHRSILWAEEEQQDLFGATQRKVKGRMSFFKRLSYNRGSPVAAWEDCLIAVRAPSPTLPGGADA